MEIADPPRGLAGLNIYYTTRRHIPKDSNLRFSTLLTKSIRSQGQQKELPFPLR